jgi:hypothetical protein
VQASGVGPSVLANLSGRGLTLVRYAGSESTDTERDMSSTNRSPIAAN